MGKRAQQRPCLLSCLLLLVLLSVSFLTEVSADDIAIEADGSTTKTSGVGYQMPHFVAYNETQTCSGDTHSTTFNAAVRGVNLGGYMVLEPWITPSLFYQFLGKGEGETGMDSYSFCEVLGGEEANRQLHAHWETWVTEDIIRELKESGAVNSLRLPIGDYQFIPYGPYLNGCWDGGLDYVDKVLDWAYSYGMNVLLDVHAMKGSQNGFDNSGQTLGLQWTTAIAYEYSPQIQFEHWPVRKAEWMGTFEYSTASYPEINYDNINHSLDVLQMIIDRYKGHPAVMGLEPVNEPWNFTPLQELKNYYWEGYLKVKRDAPYWRYVMHDSFRFDVKTWGGFMDGCPDRALDTHIYQAWSDPVSRISHYNSACSQKHAIAELENAFGPVIVGEWSLATDNCAMWLNGFNDNLAGYPRLPCKNIPCSDPYFGKDVIPNAPVDPTKPIQGPFGTGVSGPQYAFCPVDRDWTKESDGNPLSGRDWVRAPPNLPEFLDDTDNVMTHLAQKKINAFSGIGHGFYFWNFRTDLNNAQWSYMLALEKNWIPKGNLNDEKIANACRIEDEGFYRCSLRKGVPDKAIINAVHYINDVTDGTDDSRAVESMTGKDLRHGAAPLIDKYFQDGRGNGVTCDFGGIGVLVLENVTITDDDDSVGSGKAGSDMFDDDEYYTTVVVKKGMPWWEITIIIIVGSLAGSAIGFTIAMRTNKKFNKRVRESKFFNSTIGKNNLVRKSLALPKLDMTELDSLYDNESKPLKGSDTRRKTTTFNL